MEQLRMVDSAAGIISYSLTNKRIKNWNLGCGRDRCFCPFPYG